VEEANEGIGEKEEMKKGLPRIAPCTVEQDKRHSTGGYHGASCEDEREPRKNFF